VGVGVGVAAGSFGADGSLVAPVAVALAGVAVAGGGSAVPGAGVPTAGTSGETGVWAGMLAVVCVTRFESDDAAA
ncbi:MAG TPA: hypothetical protein VFR49_14330, partial [Solirubrobacteraceae bacterium]|nr:hypothetical protein [Solirubrobacteraceae bacterium]